MGEVRNQEEVMFKKVVVIALLVLSVVMAINVAGCAGSGTRPMLLREQSNTQDSLSQKTGLARRCGPVFYGYGNHAVLCRKTRQGLGTSCE